MADSSGTITITLKAGSDGGVTAADAVTAIDDWELGNTLATQSLGSFNTLQTKTCPDPAPPSNTSNLENFALRDKYGTIESFNANGMMTDSMDRLGNQTLFTYNTSQYPQQLLTVTEQGGLVTTFGYSGGNTLASVTDGYHRATTYNISGSKLTVTLPDPKFTGETQPVWTFQYNSDNLLSEIDSPAQPNSQVSYNKTQLSYDDYDRRLGPADLDNPGGGGENTPKRGGLNGGQRDGLASCLATTAQETKVL